VVLAPVISIDPLQIPLPNMLSQEKLTLSPPELIQKPTKQPRKISFDEVKESLLLKEFI